MDDVMIYALAKGQADAAAASAKAAVENLKYSFNVDETGKLAFYCTADTDTAQEG